MSGILRVVKFLYSPKVLPYTNTVNGALFFALGDGLVQKFVEKRHITGEDFQWKRIGTSMLAGSAMGYLGSYWYPLLERLAPGKTPKAIRKKLAIEMCLGLFIGSAVFYIIGAIQGKTAQQSWSQIQTNFPYLMAAEIGLYLPAQYINFNYVPMRFRMLYVEGVQLIYDCIFIYLLYKGAIDQRLEENRTRQDDSIKSL